MWRKGILFLTLASSLGVLKEARAESSFGMTYRQKPIFFYAGLGGGIERLMGRRTETLRTPVGAGSTTVGYTTGKRILENNGVVSFMGGFLGKLPPLPVLMGLEAYFGRGSTLSSFNNTRNDAAGNAQYYSTDLLRKFFYGATVRVGYTFCEDYYLYGAVGIDRSQFTTKRVLTNQPLALGTNLITRTKGFNGLVMALGLEKYFGHFMVGLDLRNIQYRRQNTMDNVTVVNGNGNLTLSFRPIIYSAMVRFGYRF